MAGIVTVDDSDPRLKYSDGWYGQGGSHELNHNAHGTHGAGKTATFTFTGTFVAVYGTITDLHGTPIVPIPLSDGPVLSPRSSYSIDGSNPLIYAPTPDEIAILYRIPFFKSPLLQDGEHTLVITSLVDNSFFWLDYLEFMPSAPKPDSSIKTSPTVTTPTSTTPVITPVSAPPPGATINTAHDSGTSIQTTLRVAGSTTQSANNFTTAVSPSIVGETSASSASGTPPGVTMKIPGSEPTKSPIGAIIGGVIGSLAFLTFIAFLLIWRRQKSAHLRHDHKGLMSSNPSHNPWGSTRQVDVVTPFNLEEAPHPISRRFTSTDAFGGNNKSHWQTNTNDGSHPGLQSVSITPTKLRHTQGDPTQISPRIIRQGQPRNNLGVGTLLGGAEEDVPPAYQQHPPVGRA